MSSGRLPGGVGGRKKRCGVEKFRREGGKISLLLPLVEGSRRVDGAGGDDVAVSLEVDAGQPHEARAGRDALEVEMPPTAARLDAGSGEDGGRKRVEGSAVSRVHVNDSDPAVGSAADAPVGRLAGPLADGPRVEVPVGRRGLFRPWLEGKEEEVVGPRHARYLSMIPRASSNPHATLA